MSGNKQVFFKRIHRLQATVSVPALRYVLSVFVFSCMKNFRTGRRAWRNCHLPLGLTLDDPK